MELERFVGTILGWQALAGDDVETLKKQFPLVQRAVIDAPPAAIIETLSPMFRLCIYADHLAAPKLTGQ